MSLALTLTGTIGQLLLALLLFMLAAVAGGSLADNTILSGWQTSLLDACLLVLPGLCVLCAGIVITCHASGSSAWAYCWYLLPLVGALPYLAFVFWLSR